MFTLKFILKSAITGIVAGFIIQACSPGQSQKNEQQENQEQQKEPKKSTFSAKIEERTDEEYPDNPSIGYRSERHHDFAHSEIIFDRQREEFVFDISIYPEEGTGDTILLEGINLKPYIPYAPTWIRDDDYMTYVGLINQEWNRQQVRFDEKGEEFLLKGGTDESKLTSRVDIARNCLNAGLWEVITYEKTDDGHTQPLYHGWFDFPPELYAELFERKNNISYGKYKKPLENWVEPENKQIDLSLLRTVTDSIPVKYTSLNDGFYPLTGARKKKYKNIITPEEPKSIREMLTDSTLFATFSQPGYYNTNDPRKTYLGRLHQLEELTVLKTRHEPTGKSGLLEIWLKFRHRTDHDKVTHLVFGGIEPDKIPTLPVADYNKGYKMPMGIANHPFYQDYKQMLKDQSENNPYFAMLMNKNKKWLDSHQVGIDGPVLFFDQNEPDMLHVMILSFERHAVVGHFSVHLPTKSA